MWQPLVPREKNQKKWQRVFVVVVVVVLRVCLFNGVSVNANQFGTRGIEAQRAMQRADKPPD